MLNVAFFGKILVTFHLQKPFDNTFRLFFFAIMCTVNSITDHGLTFGVGTVVVVCKFSMTAVTLGSSLLILLLPEARKERRRKNFNFHISFSAQLPFSPLVFTFWHLLQASDKRLIFACSLFSLHPLIHFKISEKNRCWNYLWKLFIIRNQLI